MTNEFLFCIWATNKKDLINSYVWLNHHNDYLLSKRWNLIVASKQQLDEKFYPICDSEYLKLHLIINIK